MMMIQSMVLCDTFSTTDQRQPSIGQEWSIGNDKDLEKDPKLEIRKLFVSANNPSSCDHCRNDIFGL
jgi:hypothetical protein